MVSELPPNHLDVAREVLRETDEPPASGWLPSVSGSRRRNQSLKRFSAPPRDRATESSDILPTTTCASRVSQLRPHASPDPVVPLPHVMRDPPMPARLKRRASRTHGIVRVYSCDPAYRTRWCSLPDTRTA